MEYNNINKSCSIHHDKNLLRVLKGAYQREIELLLLLGDDITGRFIV